MVFCDFDLKTLASKTLFFFRFIIITSEIKRISLSLSLSISLVIFFTHFYILFYNQVKIIELKLDKEIK